MSNCRVERLQDVTETSIFNSLNASLVSGKFRRVTMQIYPGGTRGDGGVFEREGMPAARPLGEHTESNTRVETFQKEILRRATSTKEGKRPFGLLCLIWSLCSPTDDRQVTSRILPVAHQLGTDRSTTAK